MTLNIYGVTYNDLTGQLVGALAVGISLALIASDTALLLGRNTGVVVTADKALDAVSVQLAGMVK